MCYSTHIFCSILLCLSVYTIAQEVTCPVEGEALFPHRNCSLYVICDNGIPYILECNEGLYFNPALGYCDFPEYVPECVGGTRPPTGTTPETTEPTATETIPEPTTTEAGPTSTTTTLPPETTSAPPSNGCPAEGFKLIPHPERCEKFYYCFDGEIVDEGECAEGLFFDPTIEQCNLEHLVDCTNPPPTTTTVATTTTRRPVPSCPPGPGVINLPFPGNCSLYILCINEVPILRQCANGTLFDLDTLQCVPEEEARCEVESDDDEGFNQDEINALRNDQMTCPLEMEFTKMPLYDDCHSWFECQNGVRVDSPPKSCTWGLYFYFDSQSCVPFTPAHCLMKK